MFFPFFLLLESIGLTTSENECLVPDTPDTTCAWACRRSPHVGPCDCRVRSTGCRSSLFAAVSAPPCKVCHWTPCRRREEWDVCCGCGRGCTRGLCTPAGPASGWCPRGPGSLCRCRRDGAGKFSSCNQTFGHTAGHSCQGASSSPSSVSGCWRGLAFRKPLVIF